MSLTSQCFSFLLCNMGLITEPDSQGGPCEGSGSGYVQAPWQRGLRRGASYSNPRAHTISSLLLSASLICLNFTHLGTPQTGGTPKGVGGSCWPGSGKKDYREFKNKKKTNKSHPASYFHHAPTKLKQCEIKYSSLPGQVTPPPHAPRSPLPRPSAVPSRSQWCWQQDSQGTQPPLCAFPAPPCSGGHLDLPPVPQGPRQLFQSVFPLFHTLCAAGTPCPSSLSRLNHKLGA